MDRIHTSCALTCLLAAGQASAADTLDGAALSAGPAWVWICVVIAFLVFATIIYSVLAFRPCVDSSAEMKTRCNTARELVWAVVPIAIVIAAAAPAMIKPLPEGSAVVARDLKRCNEGGSCQEYSFGRTINTGPGHCVTAVANVGANTIANSDALTQTAAPCTTLR